MAHFNRGEFIDWRGNLFTPATILQLLMFYRLQRIKAGKTEVVTAPDKGEAGEKPGRAKVVDLMALLKRSVQQSGQPKRHLPKRERQAGRKTA